MIFVTVGTQLPFPRLIGWMDSIAACHQLEIFAQTAERDGFYGHIQHKSFLAPAEYDEMLGRAELIVAHAGIGTILTAKERRLPLIMVPRRASLSEHRNDHQMATVRSISDHRGLYVAYTEDELEALLMRNDLDHAITEQTWQKTALQDFVARLLDGE